MAKKYVLNICALSEAQARELLAAMGYEFPSQLEEGGLHDYPVREDGTWVELYRNWEG